MNFQQICIAMYTLCPPECVFIDLKMTRKQGGNLQSHDYCLNK
jgi:hypothetical protein